MFFHQQEGISSESLASLELCVSQLFSGSATKEEIQKIHDALDKFSRQKGAWKDALYFLGQTTNPQTAMYSLTVLEVMWSSIEIKLSSSLHVMTEGCILTTLLFVNRVLLLKDGVDC